MAKIKEIDFADLQRESAEIMDAVKPLLATRHPMAIGAALAELTALWIAGHSANLRHDMFDFHVATVRRAYPIIAKAFKPPKKEKP
jgi:hypothetical protein